MARRAVSAALVAVLSLSLAACGSLPRLPGFGGGGNEDAVDRANRVAMVLGEDPLAADPELASVPIILPAAETLDAWPEAGGRPSKVVGHVLAADSLAVAWRSDAGRGSDRRSALTTAPVASERAVFTLDAAQTVHAFDLTTGGRLWSEELKSGNRRDQIGIGGGLAVAGDNLIVASGFGFVAAHDTATGAMIWKRDMEAPMTGSPTIKDGRIFVTSNNNELFALDLETGEVDWSDQAIAEPARVLGSPSPAAVEDIVVSPYSSGEVIAYLASNGRRLWTDALSRPGRFTPISAINDIAARPLLAGGLVIAANQSGVTAAIDGRSGQRVWAQAIGSTQAPALVGEYLFIAGVDGQIAALNAGTGAVYWVRQLRRFRDEDDQKGRVTYAGPIVASGRVILVSSLGEVLALDPQTGETLQTLDLRQPVFIEPIAAAGKLLVLTDEARLIAID